MNFNISKNGWLILGTALIIGVAFSVYFLVYVKDREKKLIENNFRVLQQIRENIRAQENYYMNEVKCSDVNNNNLQILFETEGIIFKNSIKDTACNIVSYEEFFNNDLLVRKDVFDYIIISNYDDHTASGSTFRDILYTNAPGSVGDTTFQKKNLPSFFQLTIAADEYISFNQNLDQHIYISGLVNAGSFSRQKRGVSLFVIIVFSVILVFIILNMPLIKMKIMSRSETLNASDVILSGSSIMLGSAILLILLLSGLIYFVSERGRMHQYLEDLSHQIETKFSTEMTHILLQLEQVKRDVHLGARIETVRSRKHLTIHNTSVIGKFSEKKDNARKEGENYDISGYKMYRNVLSAQTGIFSHYRHFNYIFWCDSAARALIFLTPFNNPVYVQNLGHRKYLTNVLDGNQLSFMGRNNLTAMIGFESIKSVNDKTYEVGIGISSGDSTLPILAMSTKLLSVMNAVLPEGFGFCILDDKGNTVFHSNIQKNMNENFINETLRTFLPALQSRTEAFKSVTYGKQKHMIHIRPMDSMPDHFLATFTTEESYNTPYSLALYNALLLFLAFLVFVGILYIIFYFIVYQENKLQRSGFLFDWLRPFENAEHLICYRKLFRLNLVTIFYLLISSRIIWYERDILINNLLITILVLLISSFYFLYIRIPSEIRLTSHLTRPDGKQKYFRITYLITGLVIILLLLLNRISLILNYSGTPFVLVKEILILLVNLVLLYTYIAITGIFRNGPVKDAASGGNTDKIPLLYQGYLFTWVILLAIIPIHIFFGMSYDIEKEILIKYNASRTIEHYHQWNHMIDGEFSKNFDRPDYAMFKKSMQEDSFQLLLPEFLSIKNESLPAPGSYPATGTVLFDSIYGKIRPFYNQLAFFSSGFVKDEALDKSWRVSKDSSCITSFFPMCGKLIFHTGGTEITYNMSGFFDLFKNGWTVILIFLPAALLIYFKLVQFSTKRIYGFKFKKYADAISARSSDGDHQIFNKFCSGKQLNHIFNVSLDTMHTSAASETANYIGDKDCLVCKLDFYTLSQKEIIVQGKTVSFIFSNTGEFKSILTSEGPIEADHPGDIEAFFGSQEKPVIVLIDHFEDEFKDPVLNQVKYRILNELINRPGIKLVVFSAISMRTFFDFYHDAKNTLERKIRKKTEEKERLEIEGTINAVEIEVSKWEILLSKFVEIVTPLRKNRFRSKIEEDSDYLLEEELSFGKYLSSQYLLLKNFRNLDDAPDDMVCRTQQVSSSYYFAQWNMLSKDEKLLVHDIAKNKFVNTKDSAGVFSLLNKGIFVYDHSLRSMNESFSNFVLTRMGHDEVMKKEVETRKKGAWNTTFIILLLVIVSLVIFLSIGQMSFLNDINSLFTSLGALLAIIIRFGGFFNPASS